jgi:diacylglycerol kinase family enzyme
MQSGALAHEVTLALAPLGTGNDWARSLGVSGEPRAVAALLRSGRSVAHDVGSIEFAAASGTPPCWFINVAGAGYDAFVLSLTAPGRRRHDSYLRGAISGPPHRPPRFLIRTAARAFEERLWSRSSPTVALRQWGKRRCAGSARPTTGGSTSPL